MRAAFCVVVILLGFASVGHAQDSSDHINPRWKKIEIPTIDPNFGMTAQVERRPVELLADAGSIQHQPSQAKLEPG